MEPLQPRRLQTFLERRRCPHSHKGQQKGLQQLQLEGLEVLGVQGVLVVLLDPERQKIDAF